MDAFVLDASVTISWCFPDDPTENTSYSEAILETRQEPDQLLGPISIYYSVTVNNQFPCPKVALKPKRTPAKKNKHGDRVRNREVCPQPLSPEHRR